MLHVQLISLIIECKKLSKRNKKGLEKIVSDFDNKQNIKTSIIEIKNNLTKRGNRIA